MARGLSRELSQQKNVKKTQAGNKGNQEGLTATQRAERDAKVLQEKAAAKAASKAAALAEGGAAAEKAKADEARKQAQRDAKKERAYANTQVAKQNAKLGVADPAARDFKVGGDKDGKPPKDPNRPKLSKEEKIKRAAEAAMKAAAAGSAPKKGKDKAEPDPPAAAADEPEPGPEPADEEEEEGGEEGEVDPAERAAAVAAEEAAARAQREAGGLVLKRLRGEPGLCAALAWSPGEARRLSFHQFCTFGAPDAAAAASDGVLYYELVVGEGLENPQVGFATDGFESGRDYYDGDGVGDCSHSWGIDGTRCARWHEGDEEYDFEWAAGDVIGLAANRATGHFAVSRNGAWGGGGAGVLFSDAGLRCEGGVFPVVSAEAGSFEVRLPDAASGFAHSPPPVDFWGE